MSDSAVQQKQPQQQSGVSNSDLMKEIRGLSNVVLALSARIESLESVGKNDKEVELPSKKNHNDDVGPYVKKVYDKTCIVCKKAFKTENGNLAVCPDCCLTKQQEGAAKLAVFNNV